MTSLSPSSKLKIGGAWSGLLEVDLDSWTLSMLREEVRRRSGCDSVNLICGGKILKECDGDRSLIELGLKNNSKVLATIVSADKGKALNEELASEEQRSSTLTRLKAAAVALTERHADYGSLPVEDFNLELEDQSGQKVKLGSETDQRGAMMGVMLHRNGRSLIDKQKYKDALDVLILAEEAFSQCDPKFLEIIDNFPMLQLDIVWCYFMLKDISCLSVAGMRLAKARKGFGRSHGIDSRRFRVLQEGRHQELAIYLRLDLLEGVVAYHSGNREESRKALNSAQCKYNQLQVSDEALSQMMSMGYKEKAAKRALRMTAQDIESAVNFLVEERAKKARRYEEDRQRQQEIMEQKRYGTTPNKKAVDFNRLNELVSIGFDRDLAAEALRINENDTQLALDILTDPDKNCELQSKIELKKQARAQRKNSEQAGGLSNAVAAPAGNATTVSAAAAGNAISDGNAIVAAEIAAVATEIAETDARMKDRDVEMEHDLVEKLTGDAVEDYDIDVSKEGEAIAEYLSLLDSPLKLSIGSSS